MLDTVTVCFMVYTLCDFLCAGQTSVIKTQQTVLVEVRGNAFLNCQLMQFKDIVQVTWQKILAEGKWNLTSYHKTFGKKVNPDCLHKTEFKYAGLQNGSLVIKNVTEQDEGCYVCLFDVQHESPLRGKTCIQVYGKNFTFFNNSFFHTLQLKINDVSFSLWS